MFLGTIQQAPWGVPCVPNIQHEAPREGSGTPVARLFHEIDALRGSTGPTRGAGAEPKASQNHDKNRSGNRCRTSIAKSMQKRNKNASKIDAKNDGKSARIRNPRNLVFCEGYNV